MFRRSRPMTRPYAGKCHGFCAKVSRLTPGHGSAEPTHNRPMRARELGIVIGDLEPGPLDAITDVPGIRVGHTTLVEGDAIRTGVTVVMPPELPCFAAAHRLN